MMDEYYLRLLEWMGSLTDGDYAAAVMYGVVSAGLVTGGCLWFARARRRERAERLRAGASKYFRLRPGR